MLGVLRDAELPDQVIAYAVDILPLYATATAFEETLRSLKDNAGEAGAQFPRGAARATSQPLPVDRFPHIVALAVPP